MLETQKKKKHFMVHNNISLVRTAASRTAKYYVRDARRPYCILRMQIATKELVEQQQSIEHISTVRSAGEYVGGRKLSSSKQKQRHSVQVRIVRNLRRHETSAEMPNKISITRRHSCIQLPKQMNQYFSFKMRRHITERVWLA